MRWSDLAGDQRLLVVPIGSCEQHGPHLPLDTDTRLALAWARALCDVRGDSVVAPAVGIGASGEHQGFAGTLSIGAAAMSDVVVELSRSALPEAGAGGARPFSGVLLVNAHGGNVEAIADAVATLRSESRRVAAWHPSVPEGDAHAGVTETSLMLHLHPDLVAMDRAEAGARGPLAELVGTIRAEGISAVAANGVLGDPGGATARQGAALFESLLGDLVAAAERLQPARR